MLRKLGRCAAGQPSYITPLPTAPHDPLARVPPRTHEGLPAWRVGPTKEGKNMCACADYNCPHIPIRPLEEPGAYSRAIRKNLSNSQIMRPNRCRRARCSAEVCTRDEGAVCSDVLRASECDLQCLPNVVLLACWVPDNPHRPFVAAPQATNCHSALLPYTYALLLHKGCPTSLVNKKPWLVTSVATSSGSLLSSLS